MIQAKTKRRRLIAIAAAVAGAAVTSVVGAPHAAASPQDQLWTLINEAHVRAGCPPYGHARQLGDVALQYAQTMAAHNGQKNFSTGPAFSPTTEQLLNARGYFPTSIGEMEYFNPNALPPDVRPYPQPPVSQRVQDAMNFWQSSGTKALFPNCGMQQLEVAVWIIDHNWAAAALMGTPGPAPSP